jgi:hypothetical protein
MRKWATEEGEPIGAAAGEALRLIVIDDDDEEPAASADATEAKSAIAAQADEPIARG